MKLIFGIIVAEGKDNPGRAVKVFMPYSPTARVLSFYLKCLTDHQFLDLHHGHCCFGHGFSSLLG